MDRIIWSAVDESGNYATISGVIPGLMAPARRWVKLSRIQPVAKAAGMRGISEARQKRYADCVYIRTQQRK
ncbi:hypothetical protein IB75_07490 [Nitrosococcus oceani C-27]|uniref:Uncharacterized protein n=1 Tax=Nitrosococcus oceani C-27 TaxID=314279 RepID=A0A0E2Z289_9GAMM|nr:hypothetical protein IB75_07490 [Nitrosococcus oceani C-27]KFI22512.1 hypothetical protein HW44_08700 [Nitrosococcus oceani]